MLSAATAIGETGGAQRFATASKFARITGTVPIKASSGTKTRHRFDPGGNRQLNAVLHRIAVTQIRVHPPARAYYQRKLTEGKTHKEALRCLKRQLANTLWKPLQPSNTNVRSRHLTPTTISATPQRLDIGETLDQVDATYLLRPTTVKGRFSPDGSPFIGPPAVRAGWL